MITEKAVDEIKVSHKEEVKKAINNEIRHFEAKLKWLRMKWLEISRRVGDCDEVRLISALLFRTITPIDAAIIVDNIKYFETNYQSIEKDKLGLTLQRACLCGSEHIAEFLLKELNMNSFNKYEEYILEYACASPNEEWAKKIAKEMHQTGKPQPELISLFADSSIIDAVNAIFGHRSILSKKL